MRYGYEKFPEDLENVFKDIFKKYSFIKKESKISYVKYKSKDVELYFEVDHEAWIVIGIGNTEFYYGVNNFLEFIDLAYYHKWEKKKERATRRCHYEEHIRKQLPFYKEAIEKYFTDILETGISKKHNEFIVWSNKIDMIGRKGYEFLEKLPEEHPIKQKIKKGNNTWLDDLLELMKEKDIMLNT